MRHHLLILVLGAVACRPANGGPPAPVGGSTRATVHQVLTDSGLTGRVVNVTGRCLGYTVPTIAKGPPPLTRSDWQLEDQGEAVWVTGSLPDGCTSTTPADEPTAIIATVRQDTLPALGGQGGQARRYLVRH